MANWSGTYTISAGTSGLVTAATSTTLTNTLASWPIAGSGLTNFVVRIISGTGAGQERVISSNTATQLTVPTWTTTPDTSSSYEIILQFKNADHVTGSITMNGGLIFEIEDSATVYVDGLYTITCNLSTAVRIEKTQNTMPTIEPNNKTISGLFGSWSYIDISNTNTINPKVSYLKLIGNAQFLCRPAASTGFDGSTVHHIWTEGTTTNAITLTGMTPTNNIKIENIFNRKSRTGTITNYAASTVYTSEFKKIWINRPSSAATANGATNGATTQKITRCVFRDAYSNGQSDMAAGKSHIVQDCYISSTGASEAIVVGCNTAATDAGNHIGRRNVFGSGRAFYGPTGTGAGTLESKFNDISPKRGSANRAIDIASATCYTSAVSDNDYIAGTLLALPENIDTSASTSSSASPAQYQNLTTARTNPKSVPNRPYNINNVVVGAYSGNQLTVTFDCENGAVSGQGSTTISADSLSGQPVLNVASTTGFSAGEIIEIGYGTSRFEEVEILSIGVGTITATTNLNFSHTLAQADTVKKQLRHYALPYIQYGTSSGVYDTETPTVAQEDWGLIYTGIKTSFNGVTYAWKQYGHSVTMKKLRDNTTYYFRVAAYDPLGNQLLSSENSFSTGSSLSTDGYNTNCAISINGNGELQGTLWLEQAGQPVTTGLTSASYTVYDKNDAAVSGLTQSGITPNGNGAFVITPVTATALNGFSHYRMKVTVIHSTGTYESWFPIGIGEINV